MDQQAAAGLTCLIDLLCACPKKSLAVRVCVLGFQGF